MEVNQVHGSENIATLADEFGQSRSEWYQLLKTGRELGERIRQYFTTTGHRTLEGESWRVVSVRRRQWSFRDRKAALQVLESAGLSHLVMRPDWEVMTTVLDNPDLPWAVRRQLERLAEKRTIMRLDAEPMEPSDD